MNMKHSKKRESEREKRLALLPPHVAYLRAAILVVMGAAKVNQVTASSRVVSHGARPPDRDRCRVRRDRTKRPSRRLSPHTSLGGLLSQAR